MARITVEDCVDKFDSRFELVLVASNRARKLHSGDEPTVEKDNDKNTVIALREVADETISADQFKQSLVEEYQTVSPVDEEELALEFDEENKDEDLEEVKNSELPDNGYEINESQDNTENFENKNDKISEEIKDNETDNFI